MIQCIFVVILECLHLVSFILVYGYSEVYSILVVTVYHLTKCKVILVSASEI